MIAATPVQLGKASEDIQHIISKVEYCDSPFGVPSNGMKIYWYQTDNNGTILPNTGRLVGNDRLLSHNFGQGPGFVPSDRVNFFNITWSGYFFASTDGVYNFAINKDDSSISVLSISSFTISGGKGSYLAQSSFTLNSGWQPFNYSYSELQAESYTSVLFQPPPVNNLATLQYYRPISAGVVNTTTGFLNFTILKAVDSIRGSRGMNQSAQYTISVPLTDKPPLSLSASGNETMYYYDPGLSTYVMRQITVTGGIINNVVTPLRIGRLIRISAGYQSKCTYAAGSCTYPNVNITGYYNIICEKYGNPSCPANTEPSTDYIQRFEGIITDFSVERSKIENKLNINCQDQLLLLQENLDKNYPDILSYSNAGFTISGYENNNNRKVIQSVVKRTFGKPQAYDAWPIGDTVRDILMNAGIDPTKLFGYKTVYTNLGLVSIATAIPTIAEELDRINLTRKPRYGNPVLPGTVSQESDDEYIWTSNFGDQLDDIIKRIVDTYGYAFQINNEGNVEIASIDLDKGTSTLQGGIRVQDELTLAGYYTQTTTANITGYVTGSKLYIKQAVDTGTSIYSSSWRITKNANPQNKIPQWSNNYPYDILYGAFWGPSITGSNWDSIKYTKSRFAFDIPSGFKISGMKLVYSKDTTRGAFSLTGFTRDDYCPNLKANIYFGPGTYTNNKLNSLNENPTYLVKTGFKAQDFGPVSLSKFNYIDDIDFTTVVNTTGGLYVLEFIATGTFNESIPSGIGNGRFIQLKSFVFDGTNRAYPYTTLQISGLSDKFFSSRSDIDEFGSGSRLYAEIELREKYPSTTNTRITILDSGGNQVYQKNIIPSYGYTGGTRYTNDGPDKYGDYPNIIEIQPWNLVTPGSGGYLNSYGIYQVRIQNTTANANTKIEAITAEPNAFRQLWAFDSERNIIDLNIKSNYDNIRNDILVVGDQLSTVVDIFDSQTINKNNPTYIYVFSRAIDLDSIYNLNAKHNIGRTKNFLIYEPGIKSQYHADWLASGVLLRYNKNRNGADFTTLAVPFIEPYDQVYIVDKLLFLTNNNDSIQYIESINEEISKNKYSMNLTSTPYRPWPSFARGITPIISGSDEAFTNILITNTEGTLLQTGANVKGTFTPTPTSYNVYLSEGVSQNQSLIEINYVQKQEGFTTIKVLDRLGHTVSYLCGGIENGQEVGEFRDAGFKYTERWGGIDEFGDSKINREGSLFLTGFVVNPRSPNFYAFPDRYYVDFKVIDPYDEGKVFRVNTKNLHTGYNSILNTYLTASNGRYEHGADVSWGPQADAKIVLDSTLATTGTFKPRRDVFSNHKYLWLVTGVAQKDISTPFNPPVYLTTSFSYSDHLDAISTALDQTEPRINYLIMGDEENFQNGEFKGIKIGVAFDETITNFQRVFNFKVDVKHCMHFGIMIREPNNINTNSDKLESRLRNYDIPRRGAEAGLQLHSRIKDFVAITGGLMGSDYFNTLDDLGYHKYITDDPLNNSYTNYQYSGNDGWPNFLVGNQVWDKKMYEWGTLASLDGASPQFASKPLAGVPWGNKFFFNKTPITKDTLDNYIEQKKITVVSGLSPHLEFYYNPKTINGGQLNFYEIPEFETQAALEVFKQTLREAFWIAKWYYAIDNFPEILTDPSLVFLTSSGLEMQNFLGNKTGTVSSIFDNTYWRKNTNLNKYIKLMVLHVFQFEIELFDNTGRGLVGSGQPARIFPRPVVTSIKKDNYTRNMINMQDWAISLTGGNKTNNYEKSMLFGYDKYSNRQKLVFHAYWLPGDQIKSDMQNFYSMRISGNSQGGLPSRLNGAEIEWARDWADPYYVNVYNTSTNTKESKLFYYHEGFGYGAANSLGAYWLDNTYERNAQINTYPHGFTTVPEISVEQSYITNSFLTNQRVLDPLTKSLLDYGWEIRSADFMGDWGFRKNSGPIWWEISLPTGFIFEHIDNLKGIPNRGIKPGV